MSLYSLQATLNWKGTEATGIEELEEVRAGEEKL